jgi:hypothetical protein
MMKYIFEILSLILSLDDWLSPVEHTFSPISRKLALVPVRNCEAFHHRHRNRLNVTHRGELLYRKR